MELLNIDFQPLGDMGVRVQFCDRVSPELNRKIQGFCRILESGKVNGIQEYVPAYDSVTIYYSPEQINYPTLCNALFNISNYDFSLETEQRNLVFIPTLYGGKYGPDLEKVASHNQITEQDVINIHTNTDYLIYMMGFLPGFPYMGGLSESITTPRFAKPRMKVPSGAVGIAGEQTVIYSMDSPGGGNLIGRTPVKLFDMSHEEPFLFQAGDKVRFVSVSEGEFHSIARKVENHTYKVKKEVFNVGEKYN